MEFKSCGETPANKIIKASPYAWIQFKGSDLCMDVHCKCGEHTHIDGDFIYFVKCGKCGTVYELNGHIELIERTDPIEDARVTEITDTDYGI